MLTNKHATILRDLAIRALIFDADGRVIGAPADFDHAEIEAALDALDSMAPATEPMTVDRPCADVVADVMYSFEVNATPTHVEISRPLEGLADLIDRTTKRSVYGSDAELMSEYPDIAEPANTPPKRVRVCTIDNVMIATLAYSNIVRHTMSGSELSVMALDEEMTLPGGACIVRTEDGWTLWREETDR